MAPKKPRRYECIYCIDLFPSQEECKAHPCYAVKTEKEDTKWSADMVMLLISLYKEHEKKFELVNIYQRNFLLVIAEIMKLQGYQDFTGDMCYNKWMGLRRLYMDEKTEQMSSKKRLRWAEKAGQASGSSEFRSEFQYFDAMDSVLGQKPDIVGIPGGIDTSDPDMMENMTRNRLASEAARRARKCAARESAELADSEDDELSTKLPYRYRAFLRRIDKKEEKTQRRHEEQQALRRESFDILRNIINSKAGASSTPHQANEELDGPANLRIIHEMLHAIGPILPDAIAEERELNNVADIPNEEMFDELDNIAPNLNLNEEMLIELENNAAYMPNQEFGAEVQNDLADMSDGEMDVRSCLLKEFRLRKMERRNNKRRRNEESQALIRECSELLHHIKVLNKTGSSSTPHQANEELDGVANLRIIHEMLHAIGPILPDAIAEERELNNLADIPNEEMFDELDNIAPNLNLNEEMLIELENHAAYMPNQEFGAEVQNDLADMSDGEMDVRSCLLKEFRLRKMERRNNKRRRNEESQALIRECSELLHRIKAINKSA